MYYPSYFVQQRFVAWLCVVLYFLLQPILLSALWYFKDTFLPDVLPSFSCITSQVPPTRSDATSVTGGKTSMAHFSVEKVDNRVVDIKDA